MGKFWKWPTFFSVHRCREPRENVCMKNLSDFFFVLLLKMVFLFKLTLIELQDFWLHFSEASVFFFLICKSHWIFPRKLLTRKKKDFRWAMRKINGKLLQLHWCIINRKLKNVQLNPSCSTWKIDGKNRTISCQILFFSSRSWSWLIRSPFFQLLFKHI